MHDALALFADLAPDDVTRLLDLASEREVHREDLLIEEGGEPTALFVVLEGLLEVRLDHAGGQVLGTVGPGELLGEVSWLEGRPASATVRVLEDSVVLVLPRDELAALLDGDPALGARFHRALARRLAGLLRRRSAELVSRAADTRVEESRDAWSRMAPALDQFKQHLQEGELATRKAGGPPSDELVAASHAGLDGLCRLLTAELGDDAGLDEGVREELGALVRREMHPYMLLSRIVERIYTKPRGYAGDFLTIEWMYENQPAEDSVAGQLIDRAFLERPAAKAVRNRRDLLAGEIERAVERGGAVTSLACGPARELFDIFERLDDPTRLSATCLDIDLQALALSSDRCQKAGLKRQMRFEQANLVYLATGRTSLELAPQQLMYSIGLIDYFQDRFVIALLDWIHSRLAPGGQVVLGNFHPANPDKALMDHVLDWKLIHRDEEDMHRLFEASAFGRRCTEIRFEPERVNLFAFCEKA